MVKPVLPPRSVRYGMLLPPIVRPIPAGTTAASPGTSKRMAMVDFAVVGHTLSPNRLTYDKNQGPGFVSRSLSLLTPLAPQYFKTTVLKSLQDP